MLHLLIKAQSGLHAGANWRLDQGRLTVGSSPKADVFLCDPDVPETLIVLRRSGRRYKIESLHNDARLQANDQRAVEEVLFPGQLIQLDYLHVQLMIEVVQSAFSLTGSVGDRVSQSVHSFLHMLRELGAKAICTMLLIVGMLLTTAILFFGTAGVAKSQASTVPKPTELPRAKHKESPQKNIQDHMLTNAQQQMDEFAKRLAIPKLSAVVRDNALQIEATLSRNQIAEFERELLRINQDYGDQIQIKAQVRMSEEQQAVDSLRIQQIVLGGRPAVVLRDGHRLYLGGTYKGLTVSSIGMDRVVLSAGSTVYEVTL